jgi:hypothetical protein
MVARMFLGYCLQRGSTRLVLSVFKVINICICRELADSEVLNRVKKYRTSFK